MKRFQGWTTTVSLVAMLFGNGCIGAVDGAENQSNIPGAPHLLPLDTLLYARLDNANEAREDFAKSSIGRMLSDPKLKPLATDMFAIAADVFERASDQMGVSLEEILAIPTGQVAIAVMPGVTSQRSQDLVRDSTQQDDSEEAIRRRIALKRQAQNSFSVFLLVEAGQNMDDLMKLVERLESTMMENGFVRQTSSRDDTEIVHLLPSLPGIPEIEYFTREETLVFGVGHQTAEAVLDRWLNKSDQQTLADSADFGSLMSRCIGAEETRPQLTFYIDAYHLIERMVKRQSAASFFWPLIDELGLSKFRGIGGSIFRGGEEFESIMHIHVLIEPPRDGLLGVLRPETVDSIPPDWVPADATSYTTVHWDFEQTYENFRKILAKFGQANLVQERIEGPAKDTLGLSFQDELLPNLTGRYVNCGWIERPVKLNSQATAQALELKNSEMAKAALAKFREQRPAEVSIETIDGAVVYLLAESALPGADRRQQRREAIEARRIAARQPNAAANPAANPAATDAAKEFRQGLRKPEPCVVILGDWAVYSDSRPLIERLIQTNRGTVERLIEVPEYDLILSELGGKLDGEKPFLISYLKGSDYVRQMYDLAQSPDTRKLLKASSKDNPVAGQIVDLLERDQLPPFEEFEIYFAPSGFFAYDEPQGIHIGVFTLRVD